MLASSHPKHHAPVEEASADQQDYAEELTMHSMPDQAQHLPCPRELGIILDSA
jgi:hypothetical protein